MFLTLFVLTTVKPFTQLFIVGFLNNVVVLDFHGGNVGVTKMKHSLSILRVTLLRVFFSQQLEHCH